MDALSLAAGIDTMVGLLTEALERGKEMTAETSPTVSIALRIPGNWRHPEEMFERIPQGHRVTDDRLVLPDQTEIEIFPMPPDGKFASIFRSTLRRAANPRELEVVDQYTVNVGLKGPGGSLESARKMMKAGAAIIQAGGAGVFIDNSALSHGGENWVDMAEGKKKVSDTFLVDWVVWGG